MDEQGAQRRAHVGAAADADPFQRADRVEQAAVVHVEPGGAEDAAEQQQVRGERVGRCRIGRSAVHGSTGPRASARLSIACSRSPRTAWMSSWFFSRTPSVSSTVSASSSIAVERHERRGPVERLRHPRRLVELGRAQLLHERGHLLGQPRRAPGHLRRRRSGAPSRSPDSRSRRRRSGA